MDKNKIKNYQIFSVIFTFILGTLLHFTYELSGENNIVALFSAINESVWEHLKLLYFPMLLTLIIGYLYIRKNVPNFLCSKVIGIITAILFTVIFFYTYSGILGKNIAFLDISSFFVATILGEYVAYRLMTNAVKCNKKIAIFVLIVIGICFIAFTYCTPQLGIFKDPITWQYGIIRKVSKL